MPAWVDIVTADVDSGSGLAYTIGTDLKQRDEALVEQPFQLEFTEQATASTSYVTAVSKRVRVPRGAKTLRCTVELRTTNAAHTASLKGTLSATDSDEQTTVSTAYVTRTITWTDISALRGTEVTLAIKLKISDGASQARSQSVDRITGWWALD